MRFVPFLKIDRQFKERSCDALFHDAVDREVSAGSCGKGSSWLFHCRIRGAHKCSKVTELLLTI